MSAGREDPGRCVGRQSKVLDHNTRPHLVVVDLRDKRRATARDGSAFPAIHALQDLAEKGSRTSFVVD